MSASTITNGAARERPLRIDLHVHMVGNGVAGSGGWLRLSGWHRMLARFMIRQLGFPGRVIDEDLEAVYSQHLLELVRQSSLDAVVLLAHERVHDPDGTPRDDLGSMYVPNDVVLDLAAAYPEFLAGVSIHPARRDALSELDRCLEPRRRPDEVPSELPKHRSVGSALPPILGSNGCGPAATARAHRR